MEEIKNRFLIRCDELWSLHEAEFLEVLEEAESRKINVTFVAALDFAESTAKLASSIRFAQVVKDIKQDDFDDPNQPKLPGLDAGPEASGAGPAKGKGKRKNKTTTVESFPQAEAEEEEALRG